MNVPGRPFRQVAGTETERERNVLFNNALNTFYLWLYGVRHMVKDHSDSERERNVLFNDALNTFYLWLYGIRHMVKDHSDSERERNVLFNDALNTFYLRLYGVRHMVKDHSDSEREDTRCRHIGYSFRLAARVILYAPSHRRDCTYHGLCYTSRGALPGTRNSSKGPTHEGSIRRPIAPWANALPLSYVPFLWLEHTKIDISNDVPSGPDEFDS